MVPLPLGLSPTQSRCRYESVARHEQSCRASTSEPGRPSPPSWSSSDRATWACHWPFGPWTSDSTSSDSISTRRGSSASPPATPMWRTSPMIVSTGALSTGRYEPTDDPARMAGFDVTVIDVPTPLREGVPNLSFVENAASTVARHLRPGALVVLESTSYPGTTEELVAPLLEEGSRLVAGRDFHLGYSPERIDPGNATWTLGEHPEGCLRYRRRLPGGGPGLLRPLVDQTVAGVGNPRGRAHQAPREHLSARQHRPRQRVGHVRRDRWTSTSGRPSMPPPPSHSATCASRRDPAWAATACPSTPAISPGRSRAASASHSGSWSWPTMSTSTCPTTWCAA